MHVNNNEWSRVTAAESQLSDWFSSCMLLVANALIFFHLARKKSFELSQGKAAIIAVAFMLAAVAVLGAAIASYHIRIKSAMVLLDVADRKREDSISSSLFSIVIVVACIIMAVAWIVAKDSIVVMFDIG